MVEDGADFICRFQNPFTSVLFENHVFSTVREVTFAPGHTNHHV